ncbi:hypothetical protein ACHQM5_018391 [Ranunculus cassubicifolius]
MGCRSLLYLIIVLGLSVGEITAYREVSYKDSSSRTPSISFVGEGRKLAESNNATNPGTDLADTVRVDPLDNLKKYRGGFDVRNKHYWGSTAFTGIYGYAIGAFWLLCGALFGLYLVASTLCCTRKRGNKLKKRPQPCTRHCYLWQILMAVSLAFLVIILSGVVIGGTTKFNSRVKTVMNIIIETTEGASATIFNVTGSMRDVRDNVATTNDGGAIFTFLTSTSERLDTDATELSRQARKNRRLINKILKIVYVTSTVIISVNLVAVIALTLFGFLRLRKALYTFIVLCWIMAALCWVYFGLYFFLDKFTGDTCTALRGFQQDPFNNSLSDILPCDELANAESVLLDTREGISDLIDQVNRNISTSFGQNLIQICNPFSAPPLYNYEPANCPPNTVRIGDVPQVITPLTCNGENATCGSGQFISASDYQRVEAYTRSIQNLLDAFPGMESLVDCQIVKDAFEKIISKHCKPVDRYVTMVWVSMIILSTLMVALVLMWVVKVAHDRRNHYTDGSVKPHSAPTDTSEDEESEGAIINQTNGKLDA